MEQNNQGVQINPNYVFEELINKNAQLSMENAKLNALIRQMNEKEEEENTDAV